MKDVKGREIVPGMTVVVRASPYHSPPGDCAHANTKIRVDKIESAGFVALGENGSRDYIGFSGHVFEIVEWPSSVGFAGENSSYEPQTQDKIYLNGYDPEVFAYDNRGDFEAALPLTAKISNEKAIEAVDKYCGCPYPTLRRFIGAGYHQRPCRFVELWAGVEPKPTDGDYRMRLALRTDIARSNPDCPSCRSSWDVEFQQICGDRGTKLQTMQYVYYCRRCRETWRKV